MVSKLAINQSKNSSRLLKSLNQHIGQSTSAGVQYFLITHIKMVILYYGPLQYHISPSSNSTQPIPLPSISHWLHSTFFEGPSLSQLLIDFLPGSINVWLLLMLDPRQTIQNRYSATMQKNFSTRNPSSLHHKLLRKVSTILPCKSPPLVHLNLSRTITNF